MKRVKAEIVNKVQNSYMLTCSIRTRYHRGGGIVNKICLVRSVFVMHSEIRKFIFADTKINLPAGVLREYYCDAEAEQGCTLLFLQMCKKMVTLRRGGNGDMTCSIQFHEICTLFIKSNERSEDSYIGVADFFFQEKVLKCA